MNQPISSLDLPEDKLEELHSKGYNYCKDIDFPIPYFNNLTAAPATKTALELYEEERSEGCVHTFIDTLDSALGGGIPLGQITEFCGEPGSGKTQICFQLCVSVQLPVFCGGLNGESVYICTNSNFASHRVKQIAVAVINRYQLFKEKHCLVEDKDVKLTVESIVNKISYIAIHDHIQLLAVIPHLNHWLQQHPAVKLVVIDSIWTPLKLVDSEKRTVLIYQIFQELQRLAGEFKFAIVVTNNVVYRMTSASCSYQTPALGDSYYHRLNNRIYLEKKSLNSFKATVLKSVFSPLTEVEFTLFS